MPATGAHPITNGPGMDQEDYMRRRCKFFIIALGACMVALMSYDGIVKPLSKKVCCVIDGMLHSRISWFQQRVVGRIAYAMKLCVKSILVIVGVTSIRACLALKSDMETM